MIKGKCHQEFEHYSCPLMLCKHITTGHTAAKCKINAVCITVITPLPHTWPLCHLMVVFYRRWFTRAPNTVLDFGLLVEYCAPHNFDLKWACLEQCRMLHMQCMWGMIHEIGCSLQDIGIKHVLSLECAHTWVASHYIKLKLPLVSFGSLWRHALLKCLI